MALLETNVHVVSSEHVQYVGLSNTCFVVIFYLKRQSHEKVCEIMIWDVSIGLN
jgi:hypothetical protein